MFDLNGGSSTNNNIAADNKPTQTCVSIIKGDISFESRNYIQHISNNPDNKYGDIIHMLLISSTGAEGLDLKCIRTVHIMEPYWNNYRIELIRHRAIRYTSHILLPNKQQSVYTFLYLSTFNLTPLTTDESIDPMAVSKHTYINVLVYMAKRVSIDCLFPFSRLLHL